MPSFPRALSAGAAKAKLSIEAPQNALFVQPPDVPHELPPNELIIRGLVKLHLPKARRVDDLVVRLESRALLFAPGCNIDEILVDKSLRLLDNAESQIFEAGEHAFSCEFAVPSTAAPWDRNPFGRITMCLKAEVTGEVNIKDTLELFWFVAPGPNVPAPDLDFDYVSSDESLGVETFKNYSLELLSPEVTPAALTRLHMMLEGPQYDIYIYRIELTCIQALKLASLTDPEKRASPTPLRISFAVIDAAIAKEVCTSSGAAAFDTKSPSHKKRAAIRCEAQRRSAFTLKARLPKDNVLRPSTHSGTLTPLNLSHALEVKIMYSIGTKPQLRSFVLSTPMQVSSCTLLSENIMVPAYSEADESPNPPTASADLQRWLEERDHVCAKSMDELLQKSSKWPPPHCEQRLMNAASAAQFQITKVDSPASSRPVSPTRDP